MRRIWPLMFVLPLVAKADPQDILRLECKGTLQSGIETLKPKVEDAHATLRINRQSGEFELDGLTLLSEAVQHTGTPRTRRIPVLEISKERFHFFAQYKDDVLRVDNSFEIDRFTGRMQFFETVFTHGSMTSNYAELQCQQLDRPAF